MLRRKFIKNTSTLLATTPLLFRPDFFPEMNISNGIINRKIGKFNCTIFQDLLFKYQAKDFFINADQEELQHSLNDYHIVEGNIPSPFIPLYVDTGTRKVLIDTGVGFTDKPVNVRGTMVQFKGMLLQLMVQQKIKAEDVTDVVITHFHPDQEGGMTSENGESLFPNAKFHMHVDEWDFWFSSRSDSQPAQFKYFIDKNIAPLKNGNLHLISGDFIELVPGITAVRAHGHTPGQIAVIVHSGNEHLLYISDAFLHPLHIEHIDWQTNYDFEHEAAKQSRLKLLDLCHKENMLMNAFHFDFPGLGRVSPTGSKWKWNYTSS